VADVTQDVRVRSPYFVLLTAGIVSPDLLRHEQLSHKPACDRLRRSEQAANTHTWRRAPGHYCLPKAGNICFGNCASSSHGGFVHGTGGQFEGGHPQKANDAKAALRRCERFTRNRAETVGRKRRTFQRTVSRANLSPRLQRAGARRMENVAALIREAAMAGYSTSKK